jgi:hypothetical protein
VDVAVVGDESCCRLVTRRLDSENQGRGLTGETRFPRC